MKIKELTGVYPCFESRLKCIDTYKTFIAGQQYEITGFGKSERQGVKADVWFMTPEGTKDEFNVIKSTVNALIDARILIEIEKDV